MYMMNTMTVIFLPRGRYYHTEPETGQYTNYEKKQLDEYLGQRKNNTDFDIRSI